MGLKRCNTCHLKYQTAPSCLILQLFTLKQLNYEVGKGNSLLYNTIHIKLILTKDKDGCNLQDYILGITILHWIKTDLILILYKIIPPLLASTFE